MTTEYHDPITLIELLSHLYNKRRPELNMSELRRICEHTYSELETKPQCFWHDSEAHHFYIYRDGILG